MAALAIAIPFVLLEYQFSLRGNHAAVYHLKFNPLQVLLITLCFYFLNLWLLNYFVLKTHVVWWRECLCFMLIICAFAITTVLGRNPI
jgi:hypothetical protein